MILSSGALDDSVFCLALQIQALQAVEFPGASAKDFMAAAVSNQRTNDPPPILGFACDS